MAVTGTRRAIRAIALVEALKGAVVLVAGTGVLTLIHRDLHQLAVRLVEHSHLNPASKYPQIFIDALGDLHNGQLLLLALGAALYSALRFVESYGLFRERAWAEVLAAVSGAVYLPIEVMELAERVTLLRAGVLGINVAVVAVMVQALLQRRKARLPRAG